MPGSVVRTTYGFTNKIFFFLYGLLKLITILLYQTNYMKRFNTFFLKLLLLFLILPASKAFSQKKDSLANKVFSKVEIEATFPGGDAAWTKYVFNAMKDADINWKNADQGTCRIRFIVDKHGSISDVEALNMKKTRLAKFAVKIISDGPKWRPASQDGKYVNAYREQPITLTLTNK